MLVTSTILCFEDLACYLGFIKPYTMYLCATYCSQAVSMSHL